jgi:hypothetical protein
MSLKLGLKNIISFQLDLWCKGTVEKIRQQIKWTQNTQLDATINHKILLLCSTDTAQHVLGIIMPKTC